MNNHKLDVIIPIRNCPAKVFRILETLSRETRDKDDVGVIIVDDNSTDETPQVIDRFVQDQPEGKFTLHELKEWRCMGGARNAGVAVSSADYVMFADADDDYEVGIIGEIIAAIDEKHPNLIMWGFDSIHKDMRTRWMPKIKDNSFAEVPVGVWFKAIKRDLFVKFQEGVFCEDCVWWFLQADKINPNEIVVLDKVGYLYDRRDESFSSAIVYLKKNPTTLETLAYDNILVKNNMNDRCPSDVLRCLADMYDIRGMLKQKEVKLAWAKRFSDMYRNVMTGHWAY